MNIAEPSIIIVYQVNIDMIITVFSTKSPLKPGYKRSPARAL